ncbi:MAG: tryptophan-rich sensory protein [Verrucomicrobiae bacterium]|nr:tryptophan-rich sensory protein [Verrucomicrobiae bacterium]
MKLGIRIFWCVLGIELLGGLGALTMGDALREWYPSLVKPAGTPPNFIFGPVWSVLYAMMGISLALVWHGGLPSLEKRKAMGWFFFQLALNVAWTPVFFGLRQLLIGLVVIVALWVSIGFTFRSFHRRERLAAGLLIPYWIWVTYATYLNAGYWWLNR